MLQQFGGLSAQARQEFDIGRMHLDGLAQTVADAAARRFTVVVHLDRKLANLDGQDGDFGRTLGLEEFFHDGVVGSQLLLGFQQGARIGGEARAPDDEIGADVFAGGTGDIDDL